MYRPGRKEEKRDMHANMRIVLSIYVFPGLCPHARATQVYVCMYVCMYVGCYVWIVVRHFPRCPKPEAFVGTPSCVQTCRWGNKALEMLRSHVLAN